MRTGRATIVAAVVVSLTACGARGEPTPGATESSRNTSPSAGDPLEGMWRSGEVTVADLHAAGDTLHLSKGETEDVFWGPITELPLTFEVEIDDGRWFQTQIGGDGVPEFGWDGTYEIVDETTVVATDPCGSITYRYSLDGDTLTVDMLEGKNECAASLGGDSGTGELLAQTLIYESTPFTRIG